MKLQQHEQRCNRPIYIDIPLDEYSYETTLRMTSSSKLIPFLLVCWLILCAAGFWILWVYSNTPGTIGPPNLTPVFQTHLRVDTEKPTLVLFAHPRCPCTRATMSELERLQADFKDQVSTVIVFYEPVDSGPEWHDTDLWRRARSMHQTTTFSDIGGELAITTGATTSGQIGLMDADGNLEFWGGITPSRGHEGQSTGGIAIRALLRGHEPGHRRTSVFGCSLRANPHDMECLNEEVCSALTDP
mgnify:FL=1